MIKPEETYQRKRTVQFCCCVEMQRGSIQTTIYETSDKSNVQLLALCSIRWQMKQWTHPIQFFQTLQSMGGSSTFANNGYILSRLTILFSWLLRQSTGIEYRSQKCQYDPTCSDSSESLILSGN